MPRILIVLQSTPTTSRALDWSSAALSEPWPIASMTRDSPLRVLPTRTRHDMYVIKPGERATPMPKVLQNLSVRRKLALLAIVPCVAALLITCLAIGGYEVLAFRSGVVEDLSATAESIAYSSSAALAFR